MIVRKAVLADLSDIRFIYNHSIVNTASVYHYAPFSMEKMQEWWEAKTIANLPILVAEEKEEIIGFISYGPFRPWPGYLYTVEHSLHVHPEHRRKNVGKALLIELINEAKNAGLKTMIGAVDAENDSSIKFHENLGFESTAVLKSVGCKFDRWLDLVLMQKML